MCSKKEVETFIRENATSMTAGDMAAALFLSISAICKICSKLNIHPISPKERNKAFIMAHHEEMSASEIAKELGITPKTLIALYGKSLNISFKPEAEGYEGEKRVRAAQEKSINQNKITPKDILANYRVGESHHYQAPELDPVEEIRKKLREEFKGKL